MKKTTKILNVILRDGQTLDDKLIQSAVSFVREKTIKVRAEKSTSTLKIGQIDFSNGKTRVNIIREYFCLGCNINEYQLNIERDKVYLEHDERLRSIADVEFQEELVEYLQR